MWEAQENKYNAHAGKLQNIKNVIWENGTPKHDITLIQEATARLHHCMETKEGNWTYINDGEINVRDPFEEGGFTYFCSKSGFEGSMTIIKTSLLGKDPSKVTFRATYLNGEVGRSAQIITIPNPASPAVIMNLHAPHRRYSNAAGGDSQAESHLRNMADNFQKLGMTFPDDAKVIVGGDFNSKLAEGLHSMRFGDADVQVQSTKPFGSCDSHWSKQDGYYQYDYIATSAGLIEQTPLTQVRHASDHRPLSARIRLAASLHQKHHPYIRSFDSKQQANVSRAKEQEKQPENQESSSEESDEGSIDDQAELDRALAMSLNPLNAPSELSQVEQWRARQSELRQALQAAGEAQEWHKLPTLQDELDTFNQFLTCYA